MVNKFTDFNRGIFRKGYSAFFVVILGVSCSKMLNDTSAGTLKYYRMHGIISQEK